MQMPQAQSHLASVRQVMQICKTIIFGGTELTGKSLWNHMNNARVSNLDRLRATGKMRNPLRVVVRGRSESGLVFVTSSETSRRFV